MREHPGSITAVAVILLLVGAGCADEPSVDTTAANGDAQSTDEDSTSTEPEAGVVAEGTAGDSPTSSTARPTATSTTTTITRSVPDNAELVRFEGAQYWCESGYGFGPDPCIEAARSVPVRATFFDPVVWCDDTTCTHYDPDEYVERLFEGRNYICDQSGSGFSNQYDCVTYLGGSPPIMGNPEIYCSGSDWSRECSEFWYPDELDRYEVTTIGGAPHLCEDAWQGGFGDLDCYPYWGGDPSTVGGLATYCSGSGAFLECSDDWYPNELDRYELTSINGSRYLCKDATFGTWGDQDCYLYYGGDPSSAGFGIPDLYCSGDTFNMSCDTGGYPSEWDDYTVVTIAGREYICDEGAFGDMPCVSYYGDSPSGYSFFFPDYYCSRYGSTCEPR